MDIVERLRKSYPCRNQHTDDDRTKTNETCVDSQSMCMCELEDRKEAADEIERLQKQAHYHYENGLKKDVEIERLRERDGFIAILNMQIIEKDAEIERLMEALKEIAHFNLYGDYSNAYEIPEIARAALKGNE